MKQGHQVDDAILRLQRYPLAQRLHVEKQVGVGQHHPLGITRRAGRVEDLHDGREGFVIGPVRGSQPWQKSSSVCLDIPGG